MMSRFKQWMARWSSIAADSRRRQLGERMVRETEQYLNEHLAKRDLPWPGRHSVQEDRRSVG